MANFLFWNLDNKVMSKDVAAICTEYDVDIVLLAEAAATDVDLSQTLNATGIRRYYAVNQIASRTLCYSRYPNKCCKVIEDIGGISIRHITPPIGPSLLLVGVHLPSKLHCEEADQQFNCVHLADVIRRAERTVRHSNTIVMGDFNMNPFEQGVVSSNGLHAVMDRRIAVKGTRTVQGRQYAYFYNPMWSLMGDVSEGPPGTYYYASSGYVSYFWHTFDQILLRGELLKYYPKGGVKIVEEIGGTTLLKGDGTPDRDRFSDHLPLIVNLQLEKGE